MVNDVFDHHSHYDSQCQMNGYLFPPDNCVMLGTRIHWALQAGGTFVNWGEPLLIGGHSSDNIIKNWNNDRMTIMK